MTYRTIAWCVGAFGCFLSVGPALGTNVAPNPSFELEAKRLGGWLPLGVEPTNLPPRVLITTAVHRDGLRALCVRPGPQGWVAGHAFRASYNGGEDENPAVNTNGVRGVRTIALRLDPDIRTVRGSVWIQASAASPFELSLVWTGRQGRQPAEVIATNITTSAVRQDGDWRQFELEATRPIHSHQVQLWITSDDCEAFYVDQVDVRMLRRPGVEVLVDQLGYEPLSPTKVAVLQSATDLTAPPFARLVELEGFREVLRGDWQRCEPLADWDRFHWTFDFSRITNSGRYAVVAGDGKTAVSSPPFNLRADLLRQEAAELGYRFFYFQRCGTAVPGFHAACHLDDARLPDGTHRDLSGGWHDAGDYNKYCGFTPESVYALAVAYHRQPRLFQQWDRDHNGIPDIVDEARWGAEYLVKLMNVDTLELTINTISTGYRYWGAPERETDGLPGNADDRRVTQLGSDPTWYSAALALTGAALRECGAETRGSQLIQLAVRLHAKLGGGMETLTALYAATGQPSYRERARHQAADLLRQPSPENSFRALAEFAVEFPADSLIDRIRAVAEKRVADLEKRCQPPFRLVQSLDAGGRPVSFPAYSDVNDWYVGGTMRQLDLGIEAAIAARIGIAAGRSFAENQVHWILGRNPFDVSLMEGVGSAFVPNYHHRYNAIAGNARGAVPGALLNGIIRAWPHQDRPWLDLTPEPNADYHCNEPWLPYNNRWLILMSVW